MASCSVDSYWISWEHGIDTEPDRSKNVKTLLCNRATHSSPVFRVCVLACWRRLAGGQSDFAQKSAWCFLNAASHSSPGAGLRLPKGRPRRTDASWGDPGLDLTGALSSWLSV